VRNKGGVFHVGLKFTKTLGENLPAISGVSCLSMELDASRDTYARLELIPAFAVSLARNAQAGELD
jgi:hypothetical protein